MPVTITGQPITDLSFSPDGREMFFAAGNERPGYLMISGFLPR